ncbi:hypothetical protein RCO48_33605 [Peribacillus frigoritolerans]|nr:hypothetical protein [Peribacillus frigoritolerans]
MVHPNGLGYKLYADAIYERFLDNIKQEKAVAGLPSKLHARSGFELSEIDHYEKNERFPANGRLFH